MGEDVARTVFQVAVSLRRVVLEELQDQILCVGIERWPAYRCRSCTDLFVEDDMARIGFVERWKPREHLEDEHA